MEIFFNKIGAKSRIEKFMVKEVKKENIVKKN